MSTSEPDDGLGAGGASLDPEGETSALEALSEVHGVPAIDLNQICLKLDELDTLPMSFASEHRLLPVLVRGPRLFLAMAAPNDRVALALVRERTGLEVSPYVALPSQLIRVIAAAYEAKKRGRSYYVGPACPPRVLEKAGIGPNGEPLAVAAIAPARAQVQGESSRRGQRVLLVEAIPETRASLSSQLAVSGYRVLGAATGAEAMEFSEEQDFAAVILSEALPDMHGLELAAFLRRIAGAKASPVILVTASARGWRYSEDVRRSYGVKACVPRDVAVERLSRTLALLLAPTTPETLNDRAGSLREVAHQAFLSGDASRAMELLEEALQVQPNSSSLLLDTGLLQARFGRPFDALRLLEAAVDLAPMAAAPLRNLALLYEHVGMPSLAAETWSRLLALAPQGEQASQIRLRLEQRYGLPTP